MAHTILSFVEPVYEIERKGQMGGKYLKNNMKIILPGEFTDLNTYVNAERTNRFLAASVKKNETERVYGECKKQKIKPINHDQILTFYWYCTNMKKDPDNICFAKKFILDGMRLAGVLKNDGWKQIAGFYDIFIVDKENPRVEIEAQFV